jgi:hypothetical protein
MSEDVGEGGFKGIGEISIIGNVDAARGFAVLKSKRVGERRKGKG